MRGTKASDHGESSAALLETIPLLLFIHSLPHHCLPFLNFTCRLTAHRRTAAHCLHELPEDVLHVIMRQLRGNEAVKLATLHPALRRTLGTLPSLQPSVVLDVSVIHAGACTRGEQTARRKRQRRCESFGAFRAAHPGIAIEAVTVRMELPAVLPRHVSKDAVFDMHWLPLRPLRRLCVVTDPLLSGLAQVSKPLQGALHGAHMPQGWRRHIAGAMSNLAPPTLTRPTCPLQTLQRTCLWLLFGSCPALEELAVEVEHRTVPGWAPKLVHQIRDLQLSHSLALRLHSLEVVGRSEVELHNLWCDVNFTSALGIRHHVNSSCLEWTRHCQALAPLS